MYKIVNEICDFFTEYSDIPITKDPILNRRMREVLMENQRVTTLINKEIVRRSIQIEGDYGDIEEDSRDETFDTLCRLLTIGWFNFDRYTKQYSNSEMDDIIDHVINQILDNNSRLCGDIVRVQHEISIGFDNMTL